MLNVVKHPVLEHGFLAALGMTKGLTQGFRPDFYVTVPCD